MTTDAPGRALLMFGGQAETFTVPSCQAPPAPGQPQSCIGSGSPIRMLSDTWMFAAGRWQQLQAGPHPPGQGELLADDPAIGTVVLVGQRLACTPEGLETWKWTGHAWSLLSPTAPGQVSSIGYDPVSRRLLAYGGQQPSSPQGSGVGAAGTLGYTQTWALTSVGWAELHPPNTPGRAAGVLTASPDLRRRLLVTALGQTWTWTGQTWERYPARNAPAGGSSWSGATLTAATDLARHQIVLLVTNDGTADQTWTMSGGRWTRQPATP